MHGTYQNDTRSFEIPPVALIGSQYKTIVVMCSMLAEVHKKSKLVWDTKICYETHITSFLNFFWFSARSGKCYVRSGKCYVMFNFTGYAPHTRSLRPCWYRYHINMSNLLFPRWAYLIFTQLLFAKRQVYFVHTGHWSPLLDIQSLCRIQDCCSTDRIEKFAAGRSSSNGNFMKTRITLFAHGGQTVPEQGLQATPQI